MRTFIARMYVSMLYLRGSPLRDDQLWPPVPTTRAQVGRLRCKSNLITVARLKSFQAAVNVCLLCGIGYQLYYTWTR